MDYLRARHRCALLLGRPRPAGIIYLGCAVRNPGESDSDTDRETLKARVNLLVYSIPGELGRAIAESIESCNCRTT